MAPQWPGCLEERRPNVRINHSQPNIWAEVLKRCRSLSIEARWGSKLQSTQFLFGARNLHAFGHKLGPQSLVLDAPCVLDYKRVIMLANMDSALQQKETAVY